MEKPDGADREKMRQISESKAVTSCANRGGGNGWQGMGTEVPPPSGRNETVYLSGTKPQGQVRTSHAQERKNQGQRGKEKKLCKSLGGKKHELTSGNARGAPEQEDAGVRGIYPKSTCFKPPSYPTKPFPLSLSEPLRPGGWD